MNSHTRAEPTLPEVIRAVLVGHDDDSNLGISFYRVDTVGCICVMLLDISPEALECRLAVGHVSDLVYGNSVTEGDTCTRSACDPSRT